MDNSPEIPSKAKIEAELQDAEKKIKALKSIQEDVLARGAQVVVDRRLKVGEEMTRPCCPHAQSQKLYEEWERLFFDPLFVEWWQLDLQIMKVKKQRRSLMWDLEDLNAAEASSSAPVPEIFLSEANPPLVRNTAKSKIFFLSITLISCFLQ